MVDSSVWISELRDMPTASVLKYRSLLGHKLLLVGDLVLLELLQGARDSKHAAGLERYLRQFEVVSMLDDRLAVLAAGCYRVLRAQGITIRRTVDLIIGTYCIEHGHALLHDDRDFDPMREHLGLLVA